MKIIVAGDFQHPILFETKDATAIFITTDDGSPNVIYRFLKNRNVWIRLTKGEDLAFNEIAKQLGFK